MRSRSRWGVAREEAAEGTGIKFTSGKDRTDVVIPQYEAGFLRLMGEASMLSYASLGWGDEEMVQLAASVAYAHTRGALPLLRELYLYSNAIGDAGVTALAGAIANGALPTIKTVYVSGNPGNADPLKAACKSRGIKCDA